MLHKQAESSIITVSNKIFGRKKFGEWKLYASSKVYWFYCSVPQILIILEISMFFFWQTHNKTPMPSTSSSRCVESFMEAMALNTFTVEIMTNGMSFFHLLCVCLSTVCLYVILSWLHVKNIYLLFVYFVINPFFFFDYR